MVFRIVWEYKPVFWQFLLAETVICLNTPSNFWEHHSLRVRVHVCKKPIFKTKNQIVPVSHLNIWFVKPTHFIR